jgi:hypothetical protein
MVLLPHFGTPVSKKWVHSDYHNFRKKRRYTMILYIVELVEGIRNHCSAVILSLS